MFRSVIDLLFGRLLSVVALFVALAFPVQANAAQDVLAGDDGFALVARVLPAEWTNLAAAYSAPPDETATPDVASPPTSPPGERLAGEALVEALRRGGYVVYFRHARTDFSQPDSDRQNLENCATQRNLSDEGRADARAIGEAFQTLGIPVDEVLASEYCRTRETAELMFGRVTPTQDLTSRVSTATEEERTARIGALRRLLATPPSPATNTVLVGHQFNLQDATGVSIAEGEAAIFLPLQPPIDGTPDGFGGPEVNGVLRRTADPSLAGRAVVGGPFNRYS